MVGVLDSLDSWVPGGGGDHVRWHRGGVGQLPGGL